MHKRARLSAAALAVALTAVVALPLLAAPAFESVTPENTLLYLTVRDIQGLRAKLKNYAVHDLWNEPSVRQFLDKPLQRLKDEMKKAEARTGMTFDEMWSLFHGQASVMVSMDPAAAKPEPEIVALLDVGQNAHKCIELLETFQTIAEEETETPAVNRVEEDFQGVKLFKLIPAKQGEVAAGEEPALTYAAARNVIVIGRPVAAVKRTITFLSNPPAASLETSSVYRAMLEKVSPNADFMFFANIQQIISAVTQLGAAQAGAQGQGPGPQAMIASVLDVLGLTGLVAAAGGTEFGPDAAVQRLFIRNAGIPRGLTKLIMPAPGPLHTGAEVPADTAQFLSVRIEPTLIWDEIEKILATLAPQQKQMLDATIEQLAQQLNEPFDLRNDIIGVYGPRLAFYTRFVEPLDLNTSQQFVFMVDITSKTAFDAAISKLRKLAPQAFAMLQPRDYLGYQMYVFSQPTPPNMPQPPPAAGAPKPAYAVTENSIIISNSVQAVEAHLRRLGKGGPTLRDKPEFQNLMARLPAENRVLISYQDPRHQVRLLLKALRDGQFDPFIEMMKGDPDTAEVINLFDFSLLPPAEDITKHLSPAAGCGVVQPDGLLIISVSPARPGAL